MWGTTLEFWGHVADSTLVIAFVLGGGAVVASFASSYISGRVTSALQAAADDGAKRFAVELERAKRDVAKAKEGAAKANAGLAAARAAIARANAEAAEANQGAAQANLALEKEHIARLQLEMRLAPRTLNYIDRVKAIEDLKKGAGQNVSIRYMNNNSEARNFSNQIADLLRESRWLVNSVSPIINIETPVGISVEMNEIETENKPPPYALVVFANSLRKLGLIKGNLHLQPDSGLKVGELVIMIGAKD